jgi:hypothetical protein
MTYLDFVLVFPVLHQPIDHIGAAIGSPVIRRPAILLVRGWERGRRKKRMERGLEGRRERG